MGIGNEVNAFRQPRAGVTLAPLDFEKLKTFFRQFPNNEIQVCATL